MKTLTKPQLLLCQGTGVGFGSDADIPSTPEEDFPPSHRVYCP